MRICASMLDWQTTKDLLFSSCQRDRKNFSLINDIGFDIFLLPVAREGRQTNKRTSESANTLTVVPRCLGFFFSSSSLLRNLFPLLRHPYERYTTQETPSLRYEQSRGKNCLLKCTHQDFYLRLHWNCILRESFSPKNTWIPRFD